ncbi:MAG: BlaI/MecI/CopY family transcriptional regulator [Vicinamibacterales bacterium]|jgi:predicted transcriptional regulator
MTKQARLVLTKRERQILDVLYRVGRATVSEVQDAIGIGGNSTVRAQLRVLERKGHVRHIEQGLRYIYTPTVPRHQARVTAMKHVVETFFQGSSTRALATLLAIEDAELSDDVRQALAESVHRALAFGK